MAPHPLTAALYRAVGLRIRERRDALGMTQETLANDAGISRSSLANLERGRQQIPLHVVLALAESLNVEMAALLPTRTEITPMGGVSVRLGDASLVLSPETLKLIAALRTAPKPVTNEDPEK
ncbi:MAG: helix-turn-helix domain-containing protein [Gemmatimonadaceae bacterium]